MWHKLFAKAVIYFSFDNEALVWLVLQHPSDDLKHRSASKNLILAVLTLWKAKQWILTTVLCVVLLFLHCTWVIGLWSYLHCVVNSGRSVSTVGITNQDSILAVTVRVICATCKSIESKYFHSARISPLPDVITIGYLNTQMGDVLCNMSKDDRCPLAL